MDYIQFLTILGAIVGAAAFLYKEFKSDLQNIRSDLKGFEKEIRDDIKTQSNRSDQLYTMFIDLLKERKNP